MSEDTRKNGSEQKIKQEIRYDSLNSEEYKTEDRPDCVREAGPAYVAKKWYTLEDYYALPDDQRVELIDGVFYDMAAPAVAHQIACAAIWSQLSSYIRRQKGTCLPLVSPVDVQLDRDDRTMVQPDVLVVCNRKKVINRCIYGAPDFIVEVLSESTARKDMVIKLDKYQKAGVREYWMVDLEQKRVLVYDFQQNKSVSIYGMDSQIPVRIFQEKCTVDFASIYSEIAFLFQDESEE